jgi:hypothetical protein
VLGKNTPDIVFLHGVLGGVAGCTRIVKEDETWERSLTPKKKK